MLAVMADTLAERKLLSEGAPRRMRALLTRMQSGLPAEALAAAWGGLTGAQQAQLAAALADPALA